MFSRISTYAFHQGAMQDYNGLQAKMARLNDQLSSGRIASHFQDLHGSVEKVNALENKLKTTRQYLESNTVVLARLEVMAIAVDNVIDVNDEVTQTIVTARGATEAQYPIFAQAIESNLRDFAAQLNVNIGGSFLFSGGKAATPPVAVPVPDNFSFGEPDSRYYQGDDEILTARATDTLELEYGVLASDEGFQHLVCAMKTAIAAFNSANPQQVEEALTLVTGAAEKINAIKARINGNIVVLTDANTFHESTKAYVTGVYGESVNTDTVEASTELAVYNSVLQASFQSFARISNLNLADFLR